MARTDPDAARSVTDEVDLDPRQAASCTLASFLDSPDAPPPEDWSTAASHANSDADRDSTELVERAQAARERAEELEQSAARLGNSGAGSSSLDRATAVLAAAFDVSSGRAFECLLWVAERAGISRNEVAGRFLARVEPLEPNGRRRDELIAVLNELAGTPEADRSS